jgi:hypothetical protein
VGVVGSFRSVGDAAKVAAEMIAAQAPLRRVWRFAVVQLLDDYASMLRHDGVQAAAAMWDDAPDATGDVRVDAALAAMAEYLARRDGWLTPAWARDPEREAMPWWFVTDLRGLHPRALVESPLPFRRRGVFITRGALERV